jgi:hypothetical protein
MFSRKKHLKPIKMGFFIKKKASSKISSSNRFALRECCPDL